MKKLWKRTLAMAMTACMTLGLATTVSAARLEMDQTSLGEMVQYVNHEDYSKSGAYVVTLVPNGTVITFSEPMDVAIYAEGEYGVFGSKPVTTGVTSYTISDTANTYIVTDANGGMAFFRGAASQQAPVTMVSDLEYGTTTLKLSKPVVDITVEPYEVFDFWSGETTTNYYLVYEVPVGTKVECKFGSDTVLVRSLYDTDGVELMGKVMEDLLKEQFPDGEFIEEMGMMYLPLTLNTVGYTYDFAPEAVACNLPLIKVVDEQPAAYTPRVANFTDMNWSKEFVEKVYAYGWMDGMGGGKFAPEGDLTVAQAIVLAARLHSVQVNEPIPTTGGAWYQTYVDYCKANNLLNNFYNAWEEGAEAKLTARLNTKATRMDMVKILSGAASLPGLGWNDEETVSVPDVDKDADTYNYLVYDWYRNGIVSGDPGTGAFRPNDSIKRGEVAVILCKLLGL